MKIPILKIVSIILFIAGNSNAQYYPAGLSSTLFNTWLDAMDSNTLTIVSGKVSVWADKSDKTMNALNTDASKRPIVTTINNKQFIEFRPTATAGEGLIITEKSNYLDPTTGSFLIQSIYIYPDIPLPLDSRVSTYSREGNKQFGYRFYGGSTTKSTDRLLIGIPENSDAYPETRFCGFLDPKFKDLRDKTNIIENNSFYNEQFNGSQLNVDGLSAVSYSYSAYSDINQNAGIGNRPAFQAKTHWAIGEHILMNKTANESEKFLLRLYMTLKWSDFKQIAYKTQLVVNNIPQDYRTNLIGIYKDKAQDSVSFVASNNGLGINSTQESIKSLSINEKNIFLKDSGDYLLALENNTITPTSSNFGTLFKRLSKSWFFCIADKANNGGFLNLSFDATKLNITGQIDLNNFYIIYNKQTDAYNAGANNVIPASAVSKTNGLIQFLVDSRYLKDGYYSIIYGSPSASITTIPNYASITPVTNITLAAPTLETPVNCGTYTKLSWITDSLSYQPATFNIYQSVNGAPFNLISTTQNNFYITTDLLLNTNYLFKIKALDLGGVESSFSIEMTSQTNKCVPNWRFYPQYAGLNNINMVGDTPFNNAEFEYQFESNKIESNWQTSSVFIQNNLTPNTNYTYRFRHRIKNNPASSTSEWSNLTLINSSSDSLQGGFSYQWAKFNTSDTSLYGLGYYKVMYDTTGLQFIKHAAPVGEHPRIYCNPEDRLFIRAKLLNTQSGLAVLKQIRAFTQLLITGQLKSNTDGFGGNLVYNTGAFTNNLIYSTFITGTQPGMSNFINSDYTTATNSFLLHQIAMEAFECWLFQDDADPLAPTTTYKYARIPNCKIAIINLSQMLLNDVTLLNNINDNAILFLSLAYDFIAPFMDENQKSLVRQVLAAKVRTPDKLTYGYGYTYTQASNWATFGYEIIPNLAIEGEQGYIEGTTDVWCRTVHNFLNYGIYENGAPLEGIGKNQVNAALLIALAKRGYSMLGIPNFRNFATNFLPSLVQPFGYSYYIIDLLGGTGSDDVLGGKKFNPLDPIGIKWIFPKNDKVDFMWKNFIGKLTANNILGYRYGDAVGTTKAYFAPNIPAAIFSSNYYVKDNHIFDTFDYIDGIGGLAIFRNNFDTTATQIYFHSRQDFGGHPYANRGSFSMSALGRIWIPVINTGGNSEAIYTDSTQYHSCVLVDNLGGYSPNFPTKIIQVESKALISQVSNDMKEYYANQLIPVETSVKNSQIEADPQLSAQPLLGSLNDFKYQKSKYPHFSFPNQGYPHWRYKNFFNYYYKLKKRECKKAFRTVALIKSGYPYALIVDDIQLDSTSHNYKWLAQLPKDLTIESFNVNNNNTDFKNDIILKEANGNRKLLIRILQAEGISVNAPNILAQIQNPVVSNIIRPRLIIEANTIEPKFKMLIYPYNPNMPLPTSNWNTDKSILEIVWPNDRVQNIEFFTDNTGKTNIKLTKDQKVNQVAIPSIPIK